MERDNGTATACQERWWLCSRECLGAIHCERTWPSAIFEQRAQLFRALNVARSNLPRRLNDQVVELLAAGSASIPFLLRRRR